MLEITSSCLDDAVVLFVWRNPMQVLHVPVSIDRENPILSPQNTSVLVDWSSGRDGHDLLA